MSAFHAQNPTQRVCGMVKNGARTILKIKKRKVPQIFCFFSMVLSDLDVTRDVRVLGTKSRHFILLWYELGTFPKSQKIRIPWGVTPHTILY